ncbi:hypothetical protein OAD92_01555 [Flavobacteriaceae bacterium]|nr:hypothetical protein [Flavobacteriaceae bacterium]MDC0014164.1 hypothetical protein [Flavobacteriaceae bacterium]
MAKRGPKPLSKEQVAEKVKLIHGDKYGCDKVDFVNATTAITLTCEMHGDFSILPKTLFNGAGCYKCGRIESGRKRREGVKKKFTERSNKAHNFKYDHPKTEQFS